MKFALASNYENLAKSLQSVPNDHMWRPNPNLRCGTILLQKKKDEAVRVVFMGTPPYATKILQALISSQEIEVVALFTQPDKPVGRKQIMTPPDTKCYLIEKGLSIPIYQPQRLGDEENINILKSLSFDFIVVAAYGQILPSSILKMAPCINLHASLLPRYRGASPIQQTLLAGDALSGVTAMLMDEGLDTGDILAYTYLCVDAQDNAATLYERLSEAAAHLTPDVLFGFEQINPLRQRDVDATLCRKIKKEDGLILFDDAYSIMKRYRAFWIWPRLFLPSGLKIGQMMLHETSSQNQPGMILQIEKNSIIVGCKKGSLKILTVQPPSKNEMDVLSYIRGKRIGLGDYLS